ncbi:MAG: hypothetical protein HY033_06650 [Ignavibacteriae bacterium]|nr:hypothetical protein [Ignavibacteria bacterium]MBI3364571.1 hypothetical protein [Ignavibacteriota bacterium]
MIILQIEHKVPNFDAWKKAFDNDPINRNKSGVRRYRIFRPIDDPNYVIIDLEFNNVHDAESILAALRKLWVHVEGKVIVNPQSRILETVETMEYK